MFAKLNNGRIYCAPKSILHDGLWYGNPPAEVYLAEGYKPVRFTEAPTLQPGFVAVPGWEETLEAIVQTWAVAEEPDEIPEDRAYRIITGEEE